MKNLKDQFGLTLVSERVILKPLGPDDAGFILHLLNTDGWLQYIGDRKVNSLSDAAEYIQKINANPAVVYWVVFLKVENVAAGIITLVKRKELIQPDLGFAFLPSFTRRGYAYEACCRVVEHVLRDNAISCLNAITIQHNSLSISLLKKIGFTFAEEKIIGDNLIHLYKAGADKIFISLLIHSFFSVFTNTHGRPPRLPLLAKICLHQVLLVNKSSAHNDIMNLNSFIIPRETRLTDGSLIDFEEKEIY